MNIDIGINMNIDMAKIKIIVLDRDGVINEDSPLFVRSSAEWRAIPGSLQAIAKLNKRGYKVVVASNQSGLARGYLTRDDLAAIHRKMEDELAALGGHLDDIFVCPHGPDEQCRCRKPLPGLLLDIAERFGVAPSAMLVIGDSLRDLLAARAAGCSRILVKTGNGAKTLQQATEVKHEGLGEEALSTHDELYDELQGVPVYDDLATAVDALLFDEAN